MPKRILVFNWWDIKNPKAGGAEVHLNEIFSRLAKKHDITLVCSNFPKAKKSEIINKIKIKRIAPWWLINLSSFFWYFKHKNDFDIVIDYTNKIPYLTPLYVKKPMIVLVLHLFGDIWQKELGWPGYILTKIEKCLFLIYKKRWMIALSESTKEELVNIGIDQGKIEVINPGVNHGPLEYKKANFPLVIYVGRLKKYKRIDLILKVLPEVVKLVPKLCFVIIGEGSDRKRLQKIIKDKKLTSWVRILGFISKKEKNKWFQRTWINLQPSIKEGWGLTVIEAASYKTPTIASSVPGLKEVVWDKKTGWLFGENDIEHLETLLIEVLINKAKREKAAAASFKFAQKFSWDKTAKEFEEIIDKI